MLVAPSNPFDYIGLFNTIIRFLLDPVLVVEYGIMYSWVGSVPADTVDYYVQYGKARVVRSGKDLTVLTCLAGVKECLRAALALDQEGVAIEIIDLRTIDYMGMDFETIGDSIRKTGAVLIVEYGPKNMSIGARLSDEIQRVFFDYLDVPVVRVTGLDVPVPVSKALEEASLPSVSDIRSAMRAVASRDDRTVRMMEVGRCSLIF